jgi:thiol-disulfide isomerase/thioredoxin
MKKLILSLSFILFIDCAFGQVKTGDSVPDIDFQLLNAPVKSTALSKLKGKIVLIEFWATWCSPCVDAMQHLSQLQAKYRDKLQIITITDEREARIKRFLISKRSNLWFAIDTGKAAAQLFPHTTIPHTVVISTEGKLIATTDPGLITASVMDSLLHQKEVHLADQKGILLEPSEIVKKYFFAADTVKSKFIMQAELKGSNSFSKTYPLDNVFKGRRITFVNFPLNELYRAANHNFSFRRTVNETGEKSTVLYCLDIIVENKNDLLPTLQKQLAQRFDVHDKIEPREKDVFILKVADKEKFEKIPVSRASKTALTTAGDKFIGDYVTIADLADYLESHGIKKLPVVDETASKTRLDIQLTFQPEDPESLTKALAEMGLTLEKASRKIDVLVFSK